MREDSVLQFWASRLLQRSDASDQVRLRITDLLCAFAAGLETKEGQALAKLCAGPVDNPTRIATVCAIARLSECDDIELTSCVTPGAVAIPVALGSADDCDTTRLGHAIERGYEAGIAVGRVLGGAKALPAVWPSLLAAPLIAAVTIAFIKGYDEETLVHAMALALAGSSGRAGRPSGTLSGRWIVYAHAAEKGIGAANAAGQGFRGDPMLCTGEWWDAQAGTCEIDQAAFTQDEWPGMEQTDFKPFPIARQGATAVEAFRQVLATGIDPKEIDSIEVTVPRMNAPILSRPPVLTERSSLLCNLGLQLACAAFTPSQLYDPERNSVTEDLVSFSRRVTVTPSDEFDESLAAGDWPARVSVRSAGSEHTRTTLRPGPGDDQDLLEEKWCRILGPHNRYDFFENVVHRKPEAHAMLWEWAMSRLAVAAQSGASA